jgi:proteasome alpha subunit
MTDEPYRWLEAVANRREYIRDQLKGATPVFGFSRPEGIVLCGVGTGQSKVFEIYDRHALAALGHPVDIEKIRQSLIEAAHLEGFTRAPEDVTVRRLLNFSLGPALKTAFEQVFAAPLIVEGIFAEVGATPAQDSLARFSFDGTHRLETGGIAVSVAASDKESPTVAWLRGQISEQSSVAEVIRAALAAWQALETGGVFPEKIPAALPDLGGKIVEAALLERTGLGRARYRPLDPSAWSNHG